MRKVKAVVGILVMLLCLNIGTMVTYAKESEQVKVTDSQGLIYRYPIDYEGEIEKTDVWAVSAGKLKKSEIVIPDTFKGKKVVAVDWNGFQNCKKLTGITIGKNVAYIRDYAFYGCENLSRINFKGDLVRFLFDCTFEKCTSLKKIILPRNLESISGTTFSKSGLEEITLPGKVTMIDSGAFADCKSLKKVNLNNKLTMIGSECFEGCKQLAQITIPQKVEIIEVGAFDGCKNLEKVTFQGKVNEIQKYAFRDTLFLKKSRKGKYCIMNGLLVETYEKVKGNLIINGKKKINGQKIRGISGSAYENNKELNSIRIKNVKYVTGNAFENCKAKECKIENAKKFSYWAFNDSEIQSFYVQAIDELKYCFGGLTTEKFYAEDIGKYGYLGVPESAKEAYLDLDEVHQIVCESMDSNATLYVPAEQVEEYKNLVHCNVAVWEK